MTKDSDLIVAAYEQLVQTIYKTFFANIVDAATDKDPQGALKKADQSFQEAISTARNSKDRAIKLLA